MGTRVERYARRCRCCGTTTLAPLPEGPEPGTPFSLNIVALAMYLRFVHHVSYRRLSRLLLELFGLAISEGALDAVFQRGKPHFDAETSAIWPACGGRESSARTTPACASTAMAAGTGCSKTPRWQSM